MQSCILLRSLMLATVACLALSGSRAGAAPWNVVSCDPSGEPRWQAFAQAVRTARPDSSLYTPRPFPATDPQVIADFLYHFRHLHKAKNSRGFAPLPMPKDERVVESIVNERVSYNVVRVENWTQMRCGWQHKQDFYYLVQVFEVASGVELTRATLDYTGLFVSAINMPASVPGPVEALARRLLPSAATAMDEVNRDFGVQGVDPEYVATFGTIDCDMAFPCLAFHESGLSYVVYRHELFEVSASGPRLVRGKDVGTLATNEKLLPTLAPDERLISLGGPVWTVARKATAAQIRHGLSNFR